MKKRLLSISLTLCMIVANMSALSVFALAEETTDNTAAPEVATEQTPEEEAIEETAEETLSTLSADGDVSYLSPVYKDGYYSKGLERMETKTLRGSDYTLITKESFTNVGYDSPNWDLTLYTGTYVIKDNVVFGGNKSQITIRGYVDIILTDGCYIELDNIYVNDGYYLDIYGQENNTGKLVMKSRNYGAAIGGQAGESNGRIIINGGDLTVRADVRGAGIGGGDSADGANIIINGGKIDAMGGEEGGAGIGGGKYGSGHHIYINGGEITAHVYSKGAGIGGGNGGEGHHIYINGGKVNAYGIAEKSGIGGDCGAGIGGGRKGDDGKGGNGYEIHIKGATVDAEGGDNACGIGGGDCGNGYDITIEDSDVTAIGRDNAAGIGGAHDGTAARITIKNSTVTASVDNSDTCSAAGIGGGENSPGLDITITDSTITATGGKRGAGIGGGDNSYGKNIKIVHSLVTANGGIGGAGIGGGDHGYAEDITIDNSTVYAYGNYDSAGIGGGEDGWAKKITIKNNSDVTAKGGEDDGGAGIGGGQRGLADVITIEDSKVNASGGDNAPGIGGGGGCDGADGQHITIVNSNVYAQGDEDGAGIGGGTGTMANFVTIKETKDGATIVEAHGGCDGAGIGGGKGDGDDKGRGYNINIEGGTVKAYGGSNGAAGIGGGSDAKAVNVHISNTVLIAEGGNQWADGIGSGKGVKESQNVTLDYEDGGDYYLSCNGVRQEKFNTNLFRKQKVEIALNRSKSGKHVHKWTYAAEGSTITAICSKAGHKGASQIAIQLSAPDDCTCDGTKKAIKVNGTVDGVKIPAVKYYKGSKLLKKAPSTIGTYTAKLTLGKATASVTYTIAKAEDIEKYNADLETIEDIQLTQNAAVANKSGKITVSWTAPEEYEMTSYQIYRATSASGKYSKVGTVKAGTLKYVNAKSLKKGKTYYYKVRGTAKFGALTAYTDWSDVQSAKCRKTVK